MHGNAEKNGYNRINTGLTGTARGLRKAVALRRPLNFIKQHNRGFVQGSCDVACGIIPLFLFFEDSLYMRSIQ